MDFLFQTRWTAEHKQARNVGATVLHIAIVLALSVAALGAWYPVLAALAGAYLLIDLAITFAPKDRLWPFLTDQTAHLATILAAALFTPALWVTGRWADQGWMPGAMAALAGVILATRTGGFAVGLLTKPYSVDDLPQGLVNGGALIGVPERGLIFLFVMVGQPASIGSLVAAKSVLRFESTARDQRASEYVIIGTLGSFAWAMAAAWATPALLRVPPAIGIPIVSP